MESLIHYTKKDELADSRKVFESFVNMWTKVNPSIDNYEFGLVKKCLASDKVTAGELEYGFIEAYKDPNRYGKVEWNHIWKHIKAKRETKSPFRPDAVHL